ncbi:hypothetical protein NPIL_185401, partial [Nephila pilipes]
MYHSKDSRVVNIWRAMFPVAVSPFILDGIL